MIALQKIHLLPLSHQAATLVAHNAYTKSLVKLPPHVADSPDPFDKEIPSSLEDRKRAVAAALREKLNSDSASFSRKSLLLCQSDRGLFILYAVVDCVPRNGVKLQPDTDLFLEGDPITFGLRAIHLIKDVNEPSPIPSEPSEDSTKAATVRMSFMTVVEKVKKALTMSKDEKEEAPCAGDPHRVECDDAEGIRLITEKLKKDLIVLYKGQYISLRGERHLVVKCCADGDGEILQPVLSVGVEKVHVQLAYNEVFSKVQMAPLVDTVPSVYRLDLFDDCLRPWLLRHSLNRFAEGDIVEVGGIQFKVLRTDPPSRQPEILVDNPLLPSSLALGVTSLLAESLNDIDEDFLAPESGSQRRRIGVSTSIFLGSPILPHWVDILPPRQQQAIRRLPPQLQTYALLRQIGESPPHEIERLVQTFDMPHGRRLNSQADALRDARITKACAQFIAPKEDRDDFYCSVCLTEKQSSESQIVVLPCGHQFHHRCVMHWFHRTFACPLCKLNLESKLSEQS